MRCPECGKEMYKTGFYMNHGKRYYIYDCECGAGVFKEREEEIVNHYKKIISNLIDIYCEMVYTENWGTNEWFDFLEYIGFSVEEIDNFLLNGKLL